MDFAQNILEATKIFSEMFAKLSFLDNGLLRFEKCPEINPALLNKSLFGFVSGQRLMSPSFDFKEKALFIYQVPLKYFVNKFLNDRMNFSFLVVKTEMFFLN